MKYLPVLDAPLKAPHLVEHAQDPEKYEYFVRVEWIKKLPQDKAYWEKGLHSNQNTASKLRSQFTLERLAQQFNLKD